MEIEYLNEFRVLANSQSFSEAAQKLFISQPSLSRHIEYLESELGVELFKRNSRELHITNDGILLLKYANQLEVMKSSFLAKISSNTSNSFNFVIGCDKKMANYGISRFLEHFITDNPQYKISVVSGNSNNLFKKLKAGLINAAILYSVDDINYQDFRVNELAYDNLAVMLSKSHPLAQRSSISLLELKNEPIANFISASDFLITVNKACKEAGIVPHMAYEGILDRGIVFELIEEQRCISFCWQISMEKTINDKLKIVRIAPAVTTKILFVSNKIPGPGTATTNVLISSLKDHLRRNPINA